MPSWQSRLSPVAPVVDRTVVKDELKQGSGVVVPLVLARNAPPNSDKEAALWSLLFSPVMRSRESDHRDEHGLRGPKIQ